MKKASFFKTKEGELCIAGGVTLLAFPTALIGFNIGVSTLSYVSVAMIIGGTLFSPLRAFVFKPRAK